MLGALSKLLRKQSKLQAVSVSYVGDLFYVATEYGANGSDPCFVVGPVSCVPHQDGPAKLGQAISRGLAQCRYDFVAPTRREGWKGVKFPLLETTRMKTWAALERRSNNLLVRRLGTTVTVLPCVRGKRGFSPAVERQTTLEAPSDMALGEVVVAELELARRNEGPV